MDAGEEVMNELTLDKLVRRLDQVERDNRRLRLTGALALAVIAGMVLMGQATPRKVPKMVEAEKFVVRDTDGKSLAELGSIQGSSFLHLTDRSGSGSVSISVVADGPKRLQLWDKHGPRAEMIVQTDGESGLRIMDKKGVYRISLDVQSDGLPIMRVADKNSRTRAELLLAANDTPALSFYERDKGRKFIAGMGVAKDGSVMLMIADRDQKSSAELRVPRGGLPHLRFIGKDRKILWSTPKLGRLSKPR